MSSAPGAGAESSSPPCSPSSRPPSSPSPVSLLLGVDAGGTCVPSAPQPGARITASLLGTRESQLLWPARPPRSALVVKKWRDAGARDAADDVGAWLRDAFGVRVYVDEESDAAESGDAAAGGGGEDVRADASFARFDRRAAAAGAPGARVDVVVTVGGDGTVLHASSLFQGAMPPVVAIAYGSLGFVTVHSFKSAAKVLRRIFDAEPYAAGAGAGASTGAGGAVGPQPVPVSLRMRLVVDVFRAGQDPAALGCAPERSEVVLNELLIERGPRCARMGCGGRAATDRDVSSPPPHCRRLPPPAAAPTWPLSTPSSTASR